MEKELHNMGEFYVSTGIPEEIHDYARIDTTITTPVTCCTYVNHNGKEFPVLETMRIFSADRKTSIVIHKISSKGDKYSAHMLDNMLLDSRDGIKTVIADLARPLSILRQYEIASQPNGNYCEDNPNKFLKLMKIFGLCDLSHGDEENES